MLLKAEDLERVRDNWETIVSLVNEYEETEIEFNKYRALIDETQTKYKKVPSIVEDINETIDLLRDNEHLKAKVGEYRGSFYVLKDQLKKIAHELLKYVPRDVIFKLDENRQFQVVHQWDSNLLVNIIYAEKQGTVEN